MELDSKICVVGSNGMLGHAICRQLNLEGFKNIIKCDRLEVDLCNQEDTYRFFEEKEPEYIFFLAAVAAGIQYKKNHPTEMLLKNMQMITNVMESARRINCKKMINVCSALLYPKDATIPLNEESATYVELGEIDTPYALAKAAGMQLARYYNKEFGMNFLTVVPCNFFGEFAPFDGDRAGVISALISRIHNAKVQGKKQVEVWGSGNACREFLNSQDVANACIFLMSNDTKHDLINIGRGFEFSIREVAEMIKRVVGYEGKLFFDTTKPEGRPHMQLNTNKLFEMGWRPKIDLEASIRNAYEWYLSNVV